MGSPIPEIAPLKAPQGTHLGLSVGIPTAFFALAVYWLVGQGPWSVEFGLTTVYALLAALWAPWRMRTRQGPLMKLWVWAVVTLALYLALAVWEGLPWPGTLAWEGNHGVWFALGFLQGQLAALWAGQLASRARLFQLVQGFPEGRVLEERVREFQLDADFSRGNQSALAVSLAVFAVLAVGLASLAFGKDGVLTPLLLAAFLTLCLLVGVLVRTYRREMEALMYGRRFSLADKVVPLGWSLVLAAVAGLGAWGLMALGGPWFDWNSLTLRGLPPGALLPPQPPLRPDLEVGPPGGDPRWAVLMALLMRIFQVSNIGAALDGLLTLVAWSVPVALAAFFLGPLVRWFLTGGRETKGLGARWRRLLIDQWKAFWAALKEWWTGADRRAASPLPLGPTGVREWLRSFLGGRTPGRRPYPAVVEAFLSLVRWAGPVTGYRRGETTREYLDRLSALVPDRGPALAEVRDLLDRELFGKTGLEPDHRRRFLALVASLTALPASQDGPPGVS